jgi:hypothetical protein
MKKIISLFVSALVIFAALFPVTACGRDNGAEAGPGSLAVSGFPAGCNGRYAVFRTSSAARPEGGLYLAGPANAGRLEGAVIGNGSVTLPVYLVESFDGHFKPSLKPYRGSDKDLVIYISVKREKSFEDYEVFVLDTHMEFVLEHITFTGGSAAGSAGA